MANERSNRRDGVGHWLVKIEHDVYPWSRLVEDRKTVWDGVRNYAARNALRAMKVGDLVLYYHSGADKAVVGIARVEREAFDDPTAPGEDWSAVELAPVKPLEKRATLAELRKSPALAGLMLLKQPRLSVIAVTPEEFDEIVKIGKTTVPAP
jgi:predicted RNA-binding protein with PUA-like domain